MTPSNGELTPEQEAELDAYMAGRKTQERAAVKKKVEAPLRVVGPNEGPPPEPFETRLRRNPQGGVLNSYGNVVEITRGLWGERLRLNAMRELVEYDAKPLNDPLLSWFRCDVEKRFSFSPKAEDMARALVHVADERRYHPVQEYLSTRPPWDGKRRWVLVPGVNFGLGYSTEQALSASPPLHCTLIERWAISCVARAFEPGCQVDHVLVLQGAEERRKSTFFRVLGGPWFGEGDVEIGLEGIRAMSGVWLWCWDELAGMSKRDQQSLDGFITRPKDILRPLYRNPVEHPRTTVLVATAGPGELIHAPTGGRRWWIIPVLRKMADGEIVPLVDQLWAEALHLYREGLKTSRGKATWWLDTEAEIAAHADLVDGYRVTGGLDIPVAQWLASDGCHALLYRGGRNGWITVDDVLDGLNVQAKDRDTHGLATKVGVSLRKAGWTAVEPRPRFHRVRVSAYAPPVDTGDGQP